MNRHRRSVILGTLVLLLLGVPVGISSKRDPQQPAPEETGTPGFWIARLPRPEVVILRPEQIAAFNKEIIAKLPGTVYDLTAYPASLAGPELRALVTGRELPTGALYHNGRPLTPAYLEALRRELNLPGIKGENPVRYAFTVRRASLRTFPTGDLVTEQPGDREFDIFQETAVDPAEPLLILHTSAGGRWYFVQTYNYRGWLPAQDVAVAAGRKEWLEYIRADRFLVVTGSRLRLGYNPYSPELSELEFFMGAKLPLLGLEAIPPLVDNQSPVGNYVVSLPVRRPGGGLSFKPALVPRGGDVSPGYLPYTRGNILRQAFKLQGERYGWGGMFDSRDCSALVLDVYRSFGFRLPRNASEQERVVGKKVEFLGVGGKERERLLKSLPPGATLYLPGHVMLYLGEVRGRFYVLHAIAARGDPQRMKPDGSLERIPLNGIMVTDLFLHRAAAGKTLLDSLTSAGLMER